MTKPHVNVKPLFVLFNRIASPRPVSTHFSHLFFLVCDKPTNYLISDLLVAVHYDSHSQMKDYLDFVNSDC